MKTNGAWMPGLQAARCARSQPQDGLYAHQLLPFASIVRVVACQMLLRDGLVVLPVVIRAGD